MSDGTRRPEAWRSRNVPEQHVVARPRQVAPGLVQLALRVEHVDVDADADPVAELGRLERELARRLGGLERLHLRRARLQRVVGLRVVCDHRAARRLEVVARALLEDERLADPVLDRAAAVERHVDLEADAADRVVAGDVRGDRAAPALHRGHRIDGRQALRARLLGLELGDVEGDAGPANRRMLLGGAADEVVDRDRRRRRQRDRHGELARLDVAAADQLIERDPLGDEVVVGGDLLRRRQVEARLRFARVGDGRRADLEVALGRRQLLGDRRLVGARRLQRVLGAEDVEVGLADAQHQVLLGGVEVGERRLERQLRLGDGRVVRAVEERLATVHRRGRSRCC